MTMITFRLDDITPDMNWEQFSLLDQIFTKTGTYPLLGIVPDNQDSSLKVGTVKENFWEYMVSLQQKGYTLAQHGYQHQYETIDSGILKINPFSEFAGLSYERQSEKLKKGHELLTSHGIQTDIFMAPGHTFDIATLQALKENEFHVITDGYAGWPYRYHGLSFYPSTLSEPGKCRGINTICLHPNHMTLQDMERVATFIEDNREIVYSYGEMLNLAQVKMYSLPVIFSIRKNLFVRQMKDFAACSPAAATYMKKAYHSNRYRKLMKRMLYSPMLLHAYLHRNRG